MDEVKQGHRAMWGSGNYRAVAEKILAVGELLVERAGIAPGSTVLDAACGTGNASLPAARAGARVTGLDLSPDLLAIARERAATPWRRSTGWRGTVEALPFADDAFDAVISTFGHMFAPDHARTGRGDGAGVPARRGHRHLLLVPGGGDEPPVAATAKLVPPPPDAQASLLWGTEEHVTELLGQAEFERHEVEWRDSSWRPTPTSCSRASAR